MASVRSCPPTPPSGLDRLRWWGPGLLWALSSVGAGSILFTPRVASRYGYELAWLALLVCLLMWIMIREAARYSVLTGRTLLDGFHDLPGPRGWALWVILLPQLIAAAAGVGGLAALVGSALQALLPGSLLAWTLGVLALSTVLVAWGRYRVVEAMSQALAVVLLGIAVVSAARVWPGAAEPLAGLAPAVPGDLDLPFILPWVGTILAGSMGILWYSYWAASRGYGGGVAGLGGRGDPESDADTIDADERDRRLRDWMRTLSATAAIGVGTGTVVLLAFLVLGAELLRPQGLVPGGADVAVELTRLLESVWGRAGFWMMIAAVVIALGGSILANQDGWGRSFADITLLLGSTPADGSSTREPVLRGWLAPLAAWRPEDMSVRSALKSLYVVGVTGLAPAALVLWLRDPVAIMSVSGVIATVHTPFLVGLTLWLNLRLPHPGRPGRTTVLLTAVAGLFYAVFAVLSLGSQLR